MLSTVRRQVLRAAPPEASIVAVVLGLAARWDEGATRQNGALWEGGAGLPTTVTVMEGDPRMRIVYLDATRGYLTMFRQQLIALEKLETDWVFMVEHDVAYHPSHFDFVPPRLDTFYYNQHTWRVDLATGRALFYRCNQVSGLCASRDLLVDHYRRRVAHVETHGFKRAMGFEPGSNRRARALFGETPIETWMSAAPNVDIKTRWSLTPGRWSPDQFRNKQTCLGWTESDRVPGWGVTLGRMPEFLGDVYEGRRDEGASCQLMPSAE